MNKDLNLLKSAYDTWLAADTLRRRRLRYKRFTYGDQWSDIVADNAGGCCEERHLLIDSGRRPLTNNLIRQLVKTIVGRYRNSPPRTILTPATPAASMHAIISPNSTAVSSRSL